MKTIIFNILLNFVFCIFSLSQTLKGIVYEIDNDGSLIPLPGAGVHWIETTIGTITDKDGKFILAPPCHEVDKIIVSYVGYENDTIRITDFTKDLKIILARKKELPLVEITEKFPDSYISRIKPIATEIITMSGLQKAACCNLSESFVNTASVDVVYTDAVSGAKQIQMLGLSGIYTQIITENIPSIRGLSHAYGLSQIPGQWLESIQVSKGTSSVKTGYEAITGQINVEYKKPENSEKLFINVYGNSDAKAEFNFNTSKLLNQNWSIMLLGHAEKQFKGHDMNRDNFIDMPLIEQYNFLTRINQNSEIWESKTGFKILEETRLAGMVNFNNNFEQVSNDNYGIKIKTKRYEFFTKNGFFFKNSKNNIGSIIYLNKHDIEGLFGKKSYYGKQYSFSGIVMFQSEINEKNIYTTGISLNYDNYNERLNDTTNLDNEEIVPGSFVEYTYKYNDKIDFLFGIRYDRHNHYLDFISPRLHIKYNYSDKGVIRISGGKGYRFPRILAENMSLLASSRNFVFEGKIVPEEAWNYGFNISHDFHIGKREFEINVDAYRTEFIRQMVIDLDYSARLVCFYPLKGKSYSNSVQIDLRSEIFERFDLYFAMRWNEVKVQYKNIFQQKPLISPIRSILNLSYSTIKDRWKFDFTVHYNGQSRIPDLSENPEIFRLPEKSIAYYTTFLQITRKIKYFDIYIGVENINNFKQDPVIIDPYNPFGNYFDATVVWGPVVGRMYYLGLRLVL